MTAMRPLDNAARAWVQLQKDLMHRAAAEAINASNEWRAANNALMAKARAERWDDLRISQTKAVNLPLNDAYGAFSFWAGKAQMHASLLQGELAWRTLLGADDAPVSPAPGWPLTTEPAPAAPRRTPRPYPATDDTVLLGGLVDPAPLVDPALRGDPARGGAR